MSVILTVVGNIGKDAVINQLQDGKKVINFNLAHSESYNDKNGNEINKTIWFSCSKFLKKDDDGKLAKYLTQGKTVCITTDYINTRIWTDKEKKQHVGIGITIKTLDFVGNKSWSDVKKALPEELVNAVEDIIKK